MYISIVNVLLVSIGSLNIVWAQDEPVSVLIERGNDLLARGLNSDALTVFSNAIQKDNQNYLTYFKRATTYLAMSRHSAALSDFNKVLTLKGDFSAAISQRGRVMASLGQWDAALLDLRKLDNAKDVVSDIELARTAMSAAENAYTKSDSKDCILHAGKAISVASASSSLRLLRARCHVQEGEAEEAIGDLVFATRLNPSDAEVQMLSANIFFYSIDDSERALQQVKACLHYDPDAKECKKTFRNLRKLKKSIDSVKAAKEAKTWTTAKKALKGTAEEPGLLDQLAQERDRLITGSVLSSKLHYQLLDSLDEIACEVFAESRDPSAMKTCDRVLSSNGDSVDALRSKATILTREELFEDALQILKKANDLTGGQDRRIVDQMQKAQKLLKISKQKDYYKIMGVSRDADTKSIKKRYRQLTKEFHPDKYRGDLSHEQVIKKIEGINEAYEVLSTPELRARFDNGDGKTPHVF